jgi:hypothetical protein
LKPLATRRAVRLTHERFRADTEALAKALQRALKTAEDTRAAQAQRARERALKTAEDTRAAQAQQARADHEQSEVERLVDEEPYRANERAGYEGASNVAEGLAPYRAYEKSRTGYEDNVMDGPTPLWLQLWFVLRYPGIVLSPRWRRVVVWACVAVPASLGVWLFLGQNTITALIALLTSLVVLLALALVHFE